MTAAVAYGLRAEFAGTVTQDVDGESREVPVFSGGLIVAGDDDFDVRQALEDGDGVIVVAESDAALISALDEYPALMRVEVPAGGELTSQYELMTVPKLRAEAARRELDGLGRATKQAIVDALEEHDARLAAGDTEVQASPDHPVGVTEDGGLDTTGDGVADPAPDEKTEG